MAIWRIDGNQHASSLHSFRPIETPDFDVLPEESEGNIRERTKTITKHLVKENENAKDASINYQTYDLYMKRALLLNYAPPGYSIGPFFESSTTVIRHGKIVRRRSAKNRLRLSSLERLQLWPRNSLNTSSDGWVPNKNLNAAKKMLIVRHTIMDKHDQRIIGSWRGSKITKSGQVVAV